MKPGPPGLCPGVGGQGHVGHASDGDPGRGDMLDLNIFEPYVYNIFII